MKVIAVFKTHFDIGFTDLSESIMKYICTDMLNSVFDICEMTADKAQGKRYVWTMPSLPLACMLESDYVSEKDKKRLEKLIIDGQVAWHAMPFTVHTDFCGLNELVFGLNISKKLCDRFSKNCISAKMTDVPGHSWYLPTLLNAAGIKFLHLGCNPGSTPPDVPPLFWWEGPDGSRVLTMYVKGGYGSEVLPPKDWNFPVWLAMTMTNDNVGPHSVDILNEMETKLNKYDSNGEMICGTLDDFYYALIPYVKDIPVIKKDLADTWIHGVGTYPQEVSTVRRTRQSISSIQNLYNILLCNGIIKDDGQFQEKMNKILYNLLMFDEHTWGCDVKTFLSDRKYEKKDFINQLQTDAVKFAEQSWNEQRKRANDASNEMFECEKLLFNGIDFNSNELITFNDGTEIGDYWIPVEKGASYCDKQLGMPMTTFSGVNGDELYIPAMHNSEIRCFKRCFGNVVKQNNVSVKNVEDKTTIKTPYHKAVFSRKDGSISELIDCKTGHCWVNNDKAFYRYDIYSQEDISDFQKNYIYYPYDWIIKDLGREDYPQDIKHMCFYPSLESIKVRENGESAEIVLIYASDKESFEKYGNAEKIRVSFIFYGYKPQIDIECELINKQATPFVESGHFIFPISSGKVDFCFDKTGCIIHPTKDIEKCCNTSLYCMESFVHAQSDDCGITMISNDMPLFSIGDIGILKYNKEYRQSEENTLYFNLFNNQWGTNFPQWSEGTFVYKYTVITHKGNEHFGVRIGRKYSQNPYVLCGSLDNKMTESLFSLPNSIKIFSFTQINSKTFLLALKECNGKEIDTELNFTVFKKVYSSNLLAAKGNPVERSHSQHFNPWSIHCFLCQCNETKSDK